MIIDGIEFRPIKKYGITIPHYFVSKCGKVWSDKQKKYLSIYENWRQKKGVGKPKCYEFSMTTEGKPFWDAGHQHKPKRKGSTVIEFRHKLHQAVKEAWEPYEDYLNTLNREELIVLAKESMLIDHKDDDVSNNNLNNLQYSTPLKNSNHRKLWVDITS